MRPSVSRASTGGARGARAGALQRQRTVARLRCPQGRVEAYRWACLACDQQPITWISLPGHTSMQFDWLALVLAYDLIGWRFCLEKLNFSQLSKRATEAKWHDRTTMQFWQSVTSPHSKWMGSVSVEARDAAVWTYRYSNCAGEAPRSLRDLRVGRGGPAQKRQIVCIHYFSCFCIV